MRSALLTAALLAAAAPARAIDAGCSFNEATPVPGFEFTVTPQSALFCGGKGPAICSALRRALLDKAAPAITSAEISASCTRAEAKSWDGLRRDVELLAGGHSGSARERAAAEEAYARATAGLFGERLSAADKAQLDALRTYYLAKAPSLSPDRDQAIKASMAAGLDELSPRLEEVRRGRAAERDWQVWGVVDGAFRRAFATPGSTLPDDKALLARYRETAKAFDLREFIKHGQPEAQFVVDGRPTPSGERVIEAAWQARLQQQAEDTARAAERLRASPDAAARTAQAKSLADRIASGLDDRSRLGEETTLAAGPAGDRRASAAAAPANAPGALRGPDGKAVPAPAKARDLSVLPAGMPSYVAKLDPNYARFLIDSIESDRGRVIGLSLDPRLGGFERYLETARILEVERLEAQCGPRSDACRDRAAAEARKRVYGDGADLRSALVGAGRSQFDAQLKAQTKAIVKGLIPGYDCYRLVRFGADDADDAVMKGDMCALSLLPAAGLATRGVKTAATIGRAGAAAAEAAELSNPARIGARALTDLGVNVSEEAARELALLESGVAKYNSVYKAGYHAASHQVGEGSVADLALKTIRDLKKPAGMSQADFDAMRIGLYKGALIHDVEMVSVKFPKTGGPPEVLNLDATKVNGIKVEALGEPIETRVLPNGDTVRMYAKAPDSRSNLATTMQTIGDSRLLGGANDPLVKYLALRGTAFSPEELGLLTTKTATRTRVNTELAKELKTAILKKYGRDGLRLADEMADRLGAADVMNHYVRDTPSALRASVSLEKEFQTPNVVNAKGTFGFFDFVLAHDFYKPTPVYAPFRQSYAALPLESRRNFVRNLVTYRLMQAKPELVADGVEAAIPRLSSLPEVDAIVRANPNWADLPFKDLVETVAKRLPMPPKPS